MNLSSEKAPSLLPFLKKWVKRLNLEDWHFTISYGDPSTLGEDSVGMNNHNPEFRSSNIQILHPDHYSSSCAYEPIELYVIHELLHLPIGTFFVRETHADWVLLERCVHDLARAFYKMEYPDYKPY